MVAAPTGLTVADLAEHLGGVNPVSNEDTLNRALTTARSVIGPHLVVAESDLTAEAQDTLDQAILAVAGDVWRRKDSPGGQYLLGDVGVGYLSKDPMAGVWALLQEAGLVSVAVVA